MATEYKLSYTASEINEKLGKIDKNESDIGQLQETVNDLKNNGTVGMYVDDEGYLVLGSNATVDSDGYINL